MRYRREKQRLHLFRLFLQKFYPRYVAYHCQDLTLSIYQLRFHYEILLLLFVLEYVLSVVLHVC